MHFRDITYLCFHSFHTQTFVYPEGLEEREGVLQGLESRIVDIKMVTGMFLLLHNDIRFEIRPYSGTQNNSGTAETLKIYTFNSIQ